MEGAGLVDQHLLGLAPQVGTGFLGQSGDRSGDHRRRGRD